LFLSPSLSLRYISNIFIKIYKVKKKKRKMFYFLEKIVNKKLKVIKFSSSLRHF